MGGMGGMIPRATNVPPSRHISAARAPGANAPLEAGDPAVTFRANRWFGRLSAGRRRSVGAEGRDPAARS